MPIPTDSKDNWKVPPRDSSPETIVAWVNRMWQDGENYLQSQPWYNDIDRAINVICGSANKQPIKRLSGVSYNKAKRIIRERVSTLSNFRTPPEFEVGDKKDEQANTVLNKCTNYWWYHTLADRSIREAEQWADIAGLGWLWPVWTKDFPMFGHSDIELKVLGPRDVRPIQIGREHEVQKAYGWIVTEEMPIARAHALFPEFADRLIPSRTKPSWLARTAKAVKQFLSPALNAAGKIARKEEEPVFPTIDINYTYIHDTSINTSGETIAMGEPDTSWYYEVPTRGADIPTGVNDAQGNPTFRKATAEDAMLYPLGRLIKSPGSGKDVILYDGPATDWGGMFPLIPVVNDDWPFMFGGFSAIHDLWSMQYSLEKSMRAVDDQVEVALDPPLLFDKNQIPKSVGETLLIRKAKARFGYDPMGGDPVKPALPAGYQQVPAWILESQDKMEARMDNQAGTQDLQSLVKARTAGADGMEKYLQAVGPIAQDMVRQQEASIAMLMELLKFMFFQWYRADRRMKIMGNDGLTKEDFEYKSSDMIPEQKPGEPQLSYLQRARRHVAGFYCSIVPGSLHKIPQMAEQLKFMQIAMRKILPIDWWTLAKILNIPNFGKPPEGCNTVIDRWQAQMMLEKAMAEDLGGGQQPPGRKPQGQKPPQQKQRPDGGVITQMSR